MDTVIKRINDLLNYTVSKKEYGHDTIYEFKNEAGLICLSIEKLENMEHIYSLSMWCEHEDLMKLRDMKGIDYIYIPGSRGDEVYLEINTFDRPDRKDSIIHSVEIYKSIYYVNIKDDNTYFISTIASLEPRKLSLINLNVVGETMEECLNELYKEKPVYTSITE